MFGSKHRVHEILENTEYESAGTKFLQKWYFSQVSQQSILVPMNVVSLNLSNSTFPSFILHFSFFHLQTK